MVGMAHTKATKAGTTERQTTKSQRDQTARSLRQNDELLRATSPAPRRLQVQLKELAREGHGDEDMGEKDDVETELERLVFGDSAGFRQGMQDFSLARIGEQDLEDEDDEAPADGLEGIADSDVCLTHGRGLCSAKWK